MALAVRIIFGSVCRAFLGDISVMLQFAVSSLLETDGKNAFWIILMQRAQPGISQNKSVRISKSLSCPWEVDSASQFWHRAHTKVQSKDSHWPLRFPFSPYRSSCRYLHTPNLPSTPRTCFGRTAMRCPAIVVRCTQFHSRILPLNKRCC